MGCRRFRIAWPIALSLMFVYSSAVALADAQQTQVVQRTTGTNSITADGRVIFGPPAPESPEVISRDEEGRATVRAVRLAQPLELDGKLDEAAYSTVKPLTQRTEAWVFFDDGNVYVACRCWDTAPPSEWVANEMRRDGPQIRQNDNFGVLLDTFYDRRNGTNFYVNPLGGMMDIQYTNEGSSNSDWNTVWDVRTSRFDGGWSVEIQIPFKSLRYRPGVSQIWGMQIRRGIRRRNEWAYLTPMPPDGSGAWQSSRGTARPVLPPPESRPRGQVQPPLEILKSACDRSRNRLPLEQFVAVQAAGCYHMRSSQPEKSKG